VRNWEYGILIAIILSKYFSFQTIFQKSYPREQMALDSIDNKHGFIYYLKKVRIILRYQISVYAMKLCDKIFPISKEMKINLIKDAIPGNKMTIIPYGSIVPPSPNPIEIKHLKEYLNCDKKIVFLYFGASEKLRKIEFIIDAFEKVNKERPNTILILLGAEQVDLKRLEKYIHKKNLANVTRLIGKVPRIDVINYITISDITLSIIPPLKYYLVSTPAKLIESMVLGKPVIANNLPFQQKILMESKGGICIEYDLDELTNSMIYLADHLQDASKMGKAGQDYIINNLSFNAIVDKMKNVYDSF
jgi:glycosyltransferase involved in cell wall biosynthesis